MSSISNAGTWTYRVGVIEYDLNSGAEIYQWTSVAVTVELDNQRTSSPFYNNSSFIIIVSYGGDIPKSQDSRYRVRLYNDARSSNVYTNVSLRRMRIQGFFCRIYPNFRVARFTFRTEELNNLDGVEIKY